MPPLRPLTRTSALKTTTPRRLNLTLNPTPQLQSQFQFQPKRSLASTHVSDHEPPSHESQYDPPSGWLFGVPPGEKYKEEGWEKSWFWGYYGSLAFGVVLYAYKPDTSIQTWALEEARRRLEAEGILPDPDDEPKK